MFPTEKRPDQTNNRRPTLGNIQNQRPSSRYRQGYHYQPVASTSQLSPTFVFGKKTCEIIIINLSITSD